MFDFIAVPMGHILKFLYDTIAFQNYGIALVMFTIGVKTMLLPLAIRQRRSTLVMNRLQPQLKELQDKYKNDSEKLQAKLAQFYKGNHFNPLSGCLPQLIQLPLLFGMYQVFSRPLTYMYGFSAEIIDQLFQTIPSAYQGAERMKDMSILGYYSGHPELLSQVSDILNGFSLPNMNLFGINLGIIPSRVFSMHTLSFENMLHFSLLLIPVLAFATSWIATKTARYSMPNIPEQTSSPNLSKYMVMISPIFSGIITITMPAGIGLYWIAGNIYQVIQDLFLKKFIKEK